MKNLDKYILFNHIPMLSGAMLLILSLLIFSGCESGLHPIQKSYISGTIRYTGIWPPIDSVKQIRVVAFKTYPPSNIFNEISYNNAFFSDALIIQLDSTHFVQSSEYSIEFSRPCTIKYLVAALNYGSILEWKAIGVYALTGDAANPSIIEVEEGVNYSKFDIFVDFQKLPPQPF